MKYLNLITRKSVAAVEENFIYPENMAIIIISGTETRQEFRDSLESRPLMNECTASGAFPKSGTRHCGTTARHRGTAAPRHCGTRICDFFWGGAGLREFHISNSQSPAPKKICIFRIFFSINFRILRLNILIR